MTDVQVVHLSDVPKTPLPSGGWSRMLIASEQVRGNSNSLGVSVFAAGSETSSMSHEVEEFAYVIGGRGELLVERGSVPFREGDALYIPAGSWHAIVALGSDDVSMVFGFAHHAYPTTQRRTPR